MDTTKPQSWLTDIHTVPAPLTTFPAPPPQRWTERWGELSTVLVDSVQGDAEPDTAVADDAGTRPERPANTEGPTHPQWLNTTRLWARRRETRGSCRDTDTTVVDDAEKRTDASQPDTAVADGPGSFGNAAWFFGNWGQLTWSATGSQAKRNLADKISTVLKRAPAHVIGLCE